MQRRTLIKAAVAAAFTPALAACGGSDDKAAAGSQLASWDWLVSQAVLAYTYVT